MESLDLRVLADVLAWKQADHSVTLVTVVSLFPGHPVLYWLFGMMGWSAARSRVAVSKTI